MTQANAELQVLLDAQVQLFQLQCKVEGMKAENAHRISNDLSIAYGEDAFKAVAEESGSVVNSIWSANRV